MRIDRQEFRTAVEGIGFGLGVCVVVVVTAGAGFYFAGQIGGIIAFVALIVAFPFLMSIRRG